MKQHTFTDLTYAIFAVTGGVRRTVWEENEEAQRTGRLPRTLCPTQAPRPGGRGRIKALALWSWDGWKPAGIVLKRQISALILENTNTFLDIIF